VYALHVHSTGLGFGVAASLVVTLIATITIVLTVTFARARVLKGIHIFMHILQFHQYFTSILGQKEKMCLKKNAAYETPTFNSKRLSSYILQTCNPVTAQDTSQPKIVHMSSAKNPVYEEIQ